MTLLCSISRSTRPCDEIARTRCESTGSSGMLRPARCSFTNCSRNSRVYRFAVFDLTITDSESFRAEAKGLSVMTDARLAPARDTVPESVGTKAGGASSLVVTSRSGVACE